MLDFNKDMQTVNDVAYALLKHLEDNGVHPEEFDDEDAMEFIAHDVNPIPRECYNCGNIWTQERTCHYCGDYIND